MFKKIKLIIFIFFCLFQVSAMIFYFEYYPFSRFPMYKGKISSFHFHYCQVEVELEEGQYKPYRYYGKSDIDYLFRFHKCYHYTDLSRAAVSKEVIDVFMNQYIEGIHTSKEEIKSVRFVVRFWENFNRDNMNNPDELYVISRKEINETRIK